MDARDTRWISVAEVARHPGATHDAVYRWSDSKGMPAHRAGRFWKFQPSEAAAWVKPGQEDTFRGAGSNHSLIDSPKQVP